MSEANLTREVPLVPEQSALLFVDVQNFCARRHGGEFTGLSDEEMTANYGYYFNRIGSTAVPNMQKASVRFPQAQASRSCTRPSRA